MEDIESMSDSEDFSELSDSNWETIRTEAERRLGQINQMHEKYQRQAALIFRISLATAGVIAAFGGAQQFYSVIQFLIRQIDLRAAFQIISQGGSEILATMVILSLVILGGLALLVALVAAILVPVFAAFVAYPNTGEQIVETQRLEAVTDSEKRNLRFCLANDYQDLIDLNKQAAQQSRRRLSYSFRAGIIAILAMITAVIPITALVVRDPIFMRSAASGTVGLFGLAAMVAFVEVDISPRYRQYIKPSLEVEAALVTFFLLAWAFLRWPILGNIKVLKFPIILLVPLLLPLGAIRKDDEIVFAMGVRSTLYYMLIFGGLSIIDTFYPGGVIELISANYFLPLVFTGIYAIFIFAELAFIRLGLWGWYETRRRIDG